MKTDPRPSDVPADSCSSECVLHPHRGELCQDHPTCVMALIGQLRIQPDSLYGGPRVVHEDAGRSPEGGHIRTRIVRDRVDGTTIESVELHCQTLTFELIKEPGPLEPKARY